MANVTTTLVPTKVLFKGRGLRVDNNDLEVAMINHDGSTTATVVGIRLRRIRVAQFFDWTGAILTPTVTGLNGKTLTVTGLPATVVGIVVLLKGESE